MLKKRNIVAISVAFIAGFLLIISGEHGPSGTYNLVIEKLSLFIQDQFILSVAKAIGLILVIISSLGGFAVLLGGYLILKEKTFFGKIFISLGAGFGIINFLFLIFTLIKTQEIAAIIARHTIIGWLGIALSLFARMLAE